VLASTLMTFKRINDYFCVSPCFFVPFLIFPDILLAIFFFTCHDQLLIY